MGKFKDLFRNIGLDDERYADEEYDENEDFDEDEEQEEAARPAKAPRPSNDGQQAYRKSGNIETIKPASYSDAHKIIEKLRDGNIIVFSLELVDDDLALRILDFVYGGTFALSGKIKEVGTRVYVVTNYGVNLSEIAGSAESPKSNGYR